MTESPTCFACGRAYTSGSGRFCSSHCRDAFDAGFPPYAETSRAPKVTPGWKVIAGPDTPIVPDRPRSSGGCLITCQGCRKEFVSRGLRCCSTECDRVYRERQDIEATMAEVGIAATPKRKCEACGAAIPRWHKGKAVRKDARFCSPRCQQKAKKLSGAPQGKASAISAQKPPSNGGLEKVA
jgi:predicted nucleic acid-binding Zn ribbon protein